MSSAGCSAQVRIARQPRREPGRTYRRRVAPSPPTHPITVRFGRHAPRLTTTAPTTIVGRLNVVFRSRQRGGLVSLESRRKITVQRRRSSPSRSNGAAPRALLVPVLETVPVHPVILSNEVKVDNVAQGVCLDAVNRELPEWPKESAPGRIAVHPGPINPFRRVRYPRLARFRRCASAYDQCRDSKYPAHPSGRGCLVFHRGYWVLSDRNSRNIIARPLRAAPVGRPAPVHLYLDDCHRAPPSLAVLRV